ncbi:CCA tRNA nucleotidyltransferase [Synechococcus sp. PCC 6312]|uniref:CCA tRNA nucleotidyltransferase n=1 Tax=Synechococcus sp. (strain ATCC 27167 / PCC 6312) TaxID=195253 RepID=UPI00029EE828|nr:CCA tRNA nucleotidyltransferase [Synechococcus sp. PCC 6312]AFY59725.1 tRNA nucleotidyltransferase/poly(A) polymerase [Synechococcus sp. PCC 6312]
MVNPLDPTDWPIAIRDLPADTYLVGGAVRDGLRGVFPGDLDLDFVTPAPAIPLAQQLAQKYQASFVLLDAARQIARVVFPQATLDFAQQVGDSLEADLHRRDFTINAIAYDPRGKVMVDPLHGQVDIVQKQIRMISLANLRDDPLRVLRAYRQASQLGFMITSDTRDALKTTAPQLILVAPERIRTELSYLLASPASHRYLRWVWEDGGFAHWLPQIDETGLEHLACLEAWHRAVDPCWQSLDHFLAQPLLTNPGPGEPRKRTLGTLSKLACLFNAQPEPEFIQHTLSRLTYSNREIKLIQTLLKTLPQLPQSIALKARREQFFLFRQVGSAWPGLVGLAVAMGIEPKALESLHQAWLDLENPIAHPPCLITGADLIRDFGLRPGPLIGEILQEVLEVQARGELTTKTEAGAWVRAYLEAGGNQG